MKRAIVAVGVLVLLCIVALGCQGVQLKGLEEDKVLGPQSKMGRGELRVLVAAVRFPDEEPSLTLDRIRKRAVDDLDKYVREQSYGLAWLKPDFRGWVKLPDPVSQYKLSPYNFQVDRKKVRKLVEDTMTALEKEVNFSSYDYMIVIPGVKTTPGKGYGMLCYCANPGMLTGVREEPRYVTLKSRGGKEFRGGVSVGAENSNLGMFAHDFFHAIGGVYGKKRLAPCLYDFERQSDESVSPIPEHHAVYMGQWDIMSEHFVKRDEPPQGVSSFTKIRLGWISADQAVVVEPGDTACAFLIPLETIGKPLVVKVPLKQNRYYLVENRQQIGSDRLLPDSGLLILKVDPDVQEGSGTVQVMNADPGSPRFSRPTYKLGEAQRSLFTDKENKVAVVPLWSEGGQQGVLVTTPERSREALDAALKIQKVLSRFPEPRPKGKAQFIEQCLASFKRFDFKGSGETAERALH